LFLERRAGFDIQYNMHALIRILASEKCRVEYLEDPFADMISEDQVMTVYGLKMKQPILTWIAHSHHPHSVAFNHARPIRHTRSRVEAIVFVTILSNGIRVSARRLTMPSEHVLMSHVISSPVPRRYAQILYQLSHPDYGLAHVFSERETLSMEFDLVLTPNGEYRPRINDAAIWPSLLPLIAQEQMHSNAPVLEYVQHPTQTEQEAIRGATTANVFCVFRHVGHPSLLIVTSEVGNPDNFSSGRRAIRHVPMPTPLDTPGYHPRLRAPLQMLRHGPHAANINSSNDEERLTQLRTFLIHSGIPGARLDTVGPDNFTAGNYFNIHSTVLPVNPPWGRCLCICIRCSPHTRDQFEIVYNYPLHSHHSSRFRNARSEYSYPPDYETITCRDQQTVLEALRSLKDPIDISYT
jgi:hypothetical protein